MKTFFYCFTLSFFSFLAIAQVQMIEGKEAPIISDKQNYVKFPQRGLETFYFSNIWNDHKGINKHSEKCLINYNDWELKFIDEFDATKTELSLNWYLFGDTHGDSELQLYTWDQLSVSDGKLIITADTLPNSVAGRNGIKYHYTSGWIHYKDQVKGNALFEIRCKMPEGRQQALWPAFWMWNGGCSAEGDSYREIDIFEYWGGNFNCGTNNIFWCDNGKSESCMAEYCKVQPDFFHDYHIFSVAWLKDKLVFYIDGEEIRTVTESVPAVTDDMYLIANLAISGDPSIKDVKFPQNFMIDWIKIYTIKDPDNNLLTCKALTKCKR